LTQQDLEDSDDTDYGLNDLMQAKTATTANSILKIKIMTVKDNSEYKQRKRLILNLTNFFT